MELRRTSARAESEEVYMVENRAKKILSTALTHKQEQQQGVCHTKGVKRASLFFFPFFWGMGRLFSFCIFPVIRNSDVIIQTGSICTSLLKRVVALSSFFWGTLA